MTAPDALTSRERRVLIIAATRGMLGLAAIVLVSASACNAAAPAATAAPASSDKAAVPSASAAPAGVPAELAGGVDDTLVSGDQEAVTLTLTERSYVIRRGPNRVPGSAAGSNGEIRFFGSAICEGTGTYRWSIDAWHAALRPRVGSLPGPIGSVGGPDLSPLTPPAPDDGD